MFFDMSNCFEQYLIVATSVAQASINNSILSKGILHPANQLFVLMLTSDRQFPNLHLHLSHLHFEHLRCTDAWNDH